MYPFAKTTSFILLAALGLLFLGGCSNPENISLYNPNATYRPQPTITSVTPAGSAVAGMDTIIVQGTNYSSVLEENSVFFNAQPAVLLIASPTQITLKAPLVTSDSVAIRVAVIGSTLFSNMAQYRLNAGVVTFGGLLPAELSTSIATDATGNLYAAYSSSGIEAGVIKLTPAGARIGLRAGDSRCCPLDEFENGSQRISLRGKEFQSCLSFLAGRRLFSSPLGGPSNWQHDLRP